ncbi:MAG TPA: DUF58 domain-containing protein [Bacteroidia bacterium]|nr:DUF58 domain-containing protein [Bacteroidia bacterium]
MFIRKIAYWLNFTVARWQLIVFFIFLLVAFHYIGDYFAPDDSPTEHNLHVIMQLTLKFISTTLLAVLGFSILTASAAWAYFFFHTRKRDLGLRITFGDDETTEAGWVPVRVSLRGLLRPFLGNVRARIVFSGMRTSPLFLLNENLYERKKLLRYGVSGQGRTLLNDRGIYDVEEVQFQFTDILGIIALPVTIHFTKQLITLPRAQQPLSAKAEPQATEEQTERIEIPKRVVGEYLNYKDFETGDDVRRIVWKIYARNGELVVRIPETMDPYASQLYFYVSYFRETSSPDEGIYLAELLNRYKDKVRNLYETLEKNGFEMRMPADQQLPVIGEEEGKPEMLRITSASWQKNMPPSSFIAPRNAAFVCLSSLVAPAEVYRLLGMIPAYIPVAVVRLSEAIPSPFRMHMKDLFIAPSPRPYDHLRRPWLLSPLRSELKKNEREIAGMLAVRGNGWLVSPGNE